MQRLDNSDRTFQLILNNGKILLGTITDGDIRRSILKGINIKESIAKAMNNKPIYSYEEEQSKHKSILESIPSIIKFLPIVNKKKELQYVLINKYEETFKTAIIMAGGFGKRLGDKTKNMPKPLLKIGSKNILELIINKLENANFNKIYVSTYYLHKKIESFIKNNYRNKNINVLVETNPMGTAGSINLITDNFKTLLVINGDVLTDVDLKSLYTFHHENNNDITLTVANYGFKIPFGLVKFDDKLNLKSIEEKPLINNFVLSGIYCLNRNVCSLANGDYLDMTTLISRAIKIKKKIGIFPIYEYLQDIGSTDDF